jgi:hypothetical protein
MNPKVSFDIGNGKHSLRLTVPLGTDQAVAESLGRELLKCQDGGGLMITSAELSGPPITDQSLLCDRLERFYKEMKRSHICDRRGIPFAWRMLMSLCLNHRGYGCAPKTGLSVDYAETNYGLGFVARISADALVEHQLVQETKGKYGGRVFHRYVISPRMLTMTDEMCRAILALYDERWHDDIRYYALG